ncbi:MAG: hypothetical protein AB1810_09715, partial [Pseudomonadota bacterium]
SALAELFETAFGERLLFHPDIPSLVCCALLSQTLGINQRFLSSTYILVRDVKYDIGTGFRRFFLIL